MIDELIFIFTHPEIIRGLFEFIITQWMPALLLLIVVGTFGYMIGRLAWRKK